MSSVHYYVDMTGILSRIQEIERRAKDAGLTMAELCRKASVQHSLFCRWRRGDVEPRLSSLEKLEAAIPQADQLNDLL